MSAQQARKTRDPLTHQVIGAAIEVHQTLGPGLDKNIYAQCLAWELEHNGVEVQRQVPLPVRYKDLDFDKAHELDMLVDDRLVVEIRCVERVLPVHEAQLTTYLKLSEADTGLLINFNSPLLRDGLKRVTL